MKKQILTLAIIAAVAGNIIAQNLATEITVDRTVVPVEQAAGAPRAFHPVLIRPSALAYRMPLTDYSRTSECTDTLPALPPAVFNGMTFPTHYRGYASAGYFPALNFGAEAGYRLIDRSTTRLDAWGSWQGRSYTSRRVPAADGKETGRIADQSVQLAASLSRATGRNSLLSASFTYRHDALRLPTAFDRDASQAINAYRGEIGWSTRRGHASLDASISAGRTALHSPIAVPTLLNASGKADGAAEADYRLRVEGNILRNRDIGASLLVDADILHRQRGLQWVGDFTEAAAPGHSAATIVGITPNATFNSRNLRGHIGLRLDFSHGYSGHSFRIAPDINIGWTPTATFGIYLRADGGSRHRSLASLAAICPFAPGATVASLSTSAVDARAGLTAGPFAGFSAEIYGGYATVHGALMPLLLQTSEGDFSTFGGANLSGWSVGGRLGYAWRNIVEVSADACLLPHGSYGHASASAIDRARYLVDTRLTVRPFRQLSVELSYTLRGSRRFYKLAPGTSPVETDAGNDSRLDLGATYALTSRWSAFLRVENILDSRPLLLPGLPAQGIGGLAGAVFRF